MAEDTEFAQFIAQATTTESTPVPTEPAPATVEPAKMEPVVETKTEEKPAEVKAAEPEEKKPEPEEPAWKKLVAAEKAKREAKRAAAGAPDASALQAKLDQVEAKLAQLEPEAAEWREIKQLRDVDPLAAAEKAKLEYDRLTKAYIKTLYPDKSPQTPPEINQLREKIQHVETLLQQQQEAIANEAKAKAVQSFQAEVAEVLKTKASDFELVSKHPQGAALVREIRTAHYRETATFDKQGNLVVPGEVMSTEEACARAEGWLDEFLGNFKSTKKFSVDVKAKTEESKPKKVEAPTISQDMRQGGTKSEPHGDEVEQLLLLKKQLESQLIASQGN